jgi:diaminobutyrate-2-oxoglutarate transaminase
MCDQQDMLMICDDIQVGCGRTGTFFSFERAGIEPDLVVLSKSISGNGAPMSLLLIKPHLDVWESGEHNGTFRGYQPALVGATAALAFWSQPEFTHHLEMASDYLHNFLVRDVYGEYDGIEIRGLGMIWGIDLSKMAKVTMAKEVSRRCFELGLVVETVGRFNSVLKLMPPLTIEHEVLEKGCSILKRALADCLAKTMPALTMHSSN